jgi:hypothetical protein
MSPDPTTVTVSIATRCSSPRLPEDGQGRLSRRMRERDRAFVDRQGGDCSARIARRRARQYTRPMAEKRVTIYGKDT